MMTSWSVWKMWVNYKNIGVWNSYIKHCFHFLIFYLWLTFRWIEILRTTLAEILHGFSSFDRYKVMDVKKRALMYISVFTCLVISRISDGKIIRWYATLFKIIEIELVSQHFCEHRRHLIFIEIRPNRTMQGAAWQRLQTTSHQMWCNNCPK